MKMQMQQLLSPVLIPGIKWQEEEKKVSSFDLEECNDVELVQLVRQDNAAAYQQLYERYRKKLFVYLINLVGNRDEAEDILQNVFLKTFNNIDKFDMSRKFSSWIYRIAHNEAVNHIKRKGKRYLVPWEEITTSKDKLDTSICDQSFEEKWEHEEIANQIKKTMAKLPDKYQQVLKLRYFKDCSYEDISIMLKKPINTVGTLINRAKKKLLDEVQKQEGLRM